MPTVTDKTIYELGVHEELIIDDRNSVLRVPGGWIYKSFSGQEANRDLSRPIGMQFVPYDNEFAEYFSSLAKSAQRQAETFAKLDSGKEKSVKK